MENFARDFEVETYTTVEAICSSPIIDAVYIATPNRLHREHAVSAAERGKHVTSSKNLWESISLAARRAETESASILRPQEVEGLLSVADKFDPLPRLV